MQHVLEGLIAVLHFLVQQSQQIEGLGIVHAVGLLSIVLTQFYAKLHLFGGLLELPLCLVAQRDVAAQLAHLLNVLLAHLILRFNVLLYLY